jgi:hypothetical protein
MMGCVSCDGSQCRSPFVLVTLLFALLILILF